MRFSLWLSIITSGIILFSCGKALPELKGIDTKSWKEDKGACNHLRSGMIGAMKAEKEKLLALDEMQIVELLGRADENELYKRNQKFFYYYLEPSPLCDSVNGKNATRLVIRFNAIGLAKEVSLEP
jgi:hypothetical protein